MITVHGLGIISLIFTILIFIGIRKLYFLYKKWWLMPIILVPVLIFIFITVLHISLTEYLEYSNALILMLGPATISFAIPIYEQRRFIFSNLFILSIGVFVGVAVSLISTLLLCKILNLSKVLSGSLITHSISTPFAIIVSPAYQGDSNLAALMVLLTGFFGLIIGDMLIILFKIRSAVAIGSMYGAGAHVFGTAKAMERGAHEGMISSLIMVFSGIFMVVFSPLLSLLIAPFL